MSANSARSKKPRKSGIASSISHPVVQDAPSLTALSRFSGSGNMFAFLSLAVDKHRLRIYNTTSGKAISEYVVEPARVSSLSWAWIDLSHRHVDSETLGSTKKKGKRKRLNEDTAVSEETEQIRSPANEVIALGLSDGTVQLFSPTHGRVMRTLAHPSSAKPILSFSSTAEQLWASSADGSVHIWDAKQNRLQNSLKFGDSPISALALRPQDNEQEDSELIYGRQNICLVSVAQDSTNSDKPSEVATFMGHVSPIINLQWDVSQKPSKWFLSAADRDRYIYIWDLPSPPSTEGKILASLPLDSDVRHVHMPTEGLNHIFALSASGIISIFSAPLDLSPTVTSNLVARSTVQVAYKKSSTPAHIISVTSLPGTPGRIRLARLVGGVRPLFDDVTYLDEFGSFIAQVNVTPLDSDLRLTSQLKSDISDQNRYKETPKVAAHSGGEMGHDENGDFISNRDIDGALDIDLAELSLGQRLTALTGEEPGSALPDSEEDAVQQSAVVPAHSLTRTLIQALHSSDSRLLETCLSHSDNRLIQNTVRKLPPQLAVPLLIACVERLGRGARAGSMKGGGGGASAQRGTVLLNWIKAVLAIHTGHLMTMPDLVARLSGLHSTLTARMNLQESLLSLNGRLDMVLSQIEMRSNITLNASSERGLAQKRPPTRYVEGESEESDEADVEIDTGDEGSVEDVRLGAESDEEAEEDAESDEETDSDDDEAFIDDEAEEEYDSDSEDDESE